MEKTIFDEEKYFEKMDEYFRACNYLSVAQLYLMDNVLLERELRLNDVKPNVVGHWGTAPGQNFIYIHLNRVINKYKQHMIYISGPGHGGQAIVSNVYLEGTYSEVYPNIKKVFKNYVNNFHFLEEYHHMLRQKHLVLFMKVGSLGILLHTLMVLYLITQI